MIAALAGWRVSFLLAQERGPWDVIAGMRRALLGKTGNASACVKCTAFWIAVPFALWVTGPWIDRLVVWLGLAGVAAWIDEATRPPFELREEAHELLSR